MPRVALLGVYWIETQVATLWRIQREGIDRPVREGVPADWDAELTRAGIEACSFYWAYFVAIGVLAYVVLYLVQLIMSWTAWSLDPSLVYVALAGGLYVVGSRGRYRPQPLQALAFFASLLVIVIAL